MLIERRVQPPDPVLLRDPSFKLKGLLRKAIPVRGKLSAPIAIFFDASAPIFDLLSGEDVVCGRGSDRRVQ
jgi:hypothetical protein